MNINDQIKELRKQLEKEEKRYCACVKRMNEANREKIRCSIFIHTTAKQISILEKSRG